QKRTRQQRVATVELPPGVWGTALSQLQRGSVLLRLALCSLVALFLWGFTRGWEPPFPYQLGEIPQRDIVTSVDFEQIDVKATEEARQRARRLAKATYNQDPEPLVQLRAQLRSEISKLLAAEKLEDVDAELWRQFTPPLAASTPDPTPAEKQEQFSRFREGFSVENALELFDEQMAEVMAPFEQWGLLEALPAEHENVNFEEIFVRVREPDGEGYSTAAIRAITQVRIEDAADQLKKALEKNFSSVELAQRIFAWLRPRLMTTLTFDLAETRLSQDKEAADTAEVTKTFHASEDTLAKAGKPLEMEQMELLQLEYQTRLEAQDLGARIRRTLAVFGMYVAMYTLCGFYIHLRKPQVLQELLRFVSLLTLVLITVVLARILSSYMWGWGADLIPLLLLAMALAIAYQQELALLISACVTLVIVISIGHDMAHALVLMATVAGAVLVLKQVRTRGKLLSVGFVAACVALFTTLGVGTLDGQPWTLLLQNGLLLALWAIIAGSLMTVLLPTVESVFEVQTDLSLIELGDPAHPLLQELIRRAPGTYNHSITVASLAEAAADSINARGLLVRVGAYFHDIGKMLKPGYFIENQSQGDNRHDSLVPAMSTLVIIAHVKDGADLARQNKLPEQIIDFIQQHHGTTLVEYFYRQASEQRDKDPESAEVDESSFRYPGPKPQTKEAGVLMLADAVESASRALKEPTPARIETIVEQLSGKRLMDGQFDECGLTLEEVHKIGESLVKSLTAMYHGRVKYPGQETA
ncbi:MAG: HDIG domain-containing protein, partial [Pirellulales bacterium]|nr:HDIG domain-containing protein [Pirellulales bacterium]